MTPRTLPSSQANTAFFRHPLLPILTAVGVTVLAVVLTRRLVTGLHVDSVEGLARFLAVCAIAPLPSAVFSAVALNMMIGADLLDSLRIWWSAHALGFAVLGVFGLTLRRTHLDILRQPVRLAEGVGLSALIMGACYAIFSQLSLPYGSCCCRCWCSWRCASVSSASPGP